MLNSTLLAHGVCALGALVFYYYKLWSAVHVSVRNLNQLQTVFGMRGVI